jgi:hypothetical protein
MTSLLTIATAPTLGDIRRLGREDRTALTTFQRVHGSP